jgi:hypothetical protein
LTLATLHTNKNKTEIHMDFKRKLLIAALPLAFCLSSTAYAEMTLKIAEIDRGRSGKHGQENRRSHRR